MPERVYGRQQQGVGQRQGGYRRDGQTRYPPQQPPALRATASTACIPRSVEQRRPRHDVSGGTTIDTKGSLGIGVYGLNCATSSSGDIDIDVTGAETAIDTEGASAFGIYGLNFRSTGGKQRSTSACRAARPCRPTSGAGAHGIHAGMSPARGLAVTVGVGLDGDRGRGECERRADRTASHRTATRSTDEVPDGTLERSRGASATTATAQAPVTA